MKRVLLFVALSILFFSCAKEDPLRIDVTSGTVKFELSAVHPAATKAVKAGWEAGDVIFVFFDNVPAPRYLRMTYDGASWKTAEMDGATPAPDCLGLEEGGTGSMRAIFLPFGSDATVLSSGGRFKFSTTYYTYYLTSVLDYSVTDNKVSGAFKMEIPEDYVQFFMEGSTPKDGDYTLGTDAVVPVGVEYVNPDGTIVETSDKSAGDDMTGYAYGDGYLFSGKLTYWPEQRNYFYFAKTDVNRHRHNFVRSDLFVEVKKLSSHSAVKLPSDDSQKWQGVGRGIRVKMRTDAGEDLGLWLSCNYNQDVPESLGDKYSFADAKALNVVIPSERQMEALVKKCTWHWMSVHGVTGMVVKSATGFLFLPSDNKTGSEGHYWSSSRTSLYGARLYFHQNSIINVTSYTSLLSSKYPLRQVMETDGQ